MHYHEERTLAQFEDSSTLRRSIILAAALSPAFAALFVGLRFYTARAILRGGIHKDDCEFFFPFFATRPDAPGLDVPGLDVVRCSQLFRQGLFWLRWYVPMVPSFGKLHAHWHRSCRLASP